MLNVTILAFQLFVAAAAAEAAVRPGQIPAELKAVEANYVKAGTLIAKITQIQLAATSGKKTTSHGLIMIKQPDKLRWQTVKPDPNLLVSDGKTVWYYTPPFDESEPGQVIERKASAIQSDWSQALLSGKISKQKGIQVKVLKQNRFLLTPKKGSAGTVMKAEVVVDPNKHMITKVILTHKGGNQAEITLSEIKLGEPLEDAEFHFVKPPNTEKID